jgi:hypothetical protein
LAASFNEASSFSFKSTLFWFILILFSVDSKL